MCVNITILYSKLYLFQLKYFCYWLREAFLKLFVAMYLIPHLTVIPQALYPY